MTFQDTVAREERRQAMLLSNLRWRSISAACALVVPALLALLFYRQELKIRALADHGKLESATLVDVTRQGSSEYARYSYAVDGLTYTWSVARAAAAYAPGERFPISVLPEDPSFSRPGFPYSSDRMAADLNLPVRRGVPLLAFTFFAMFAVLCHLKVRRAQSGQSSTSARRLSPEAVGRVLAVVLLAAILATGFDAKVRAVQIAALGRTPLGLPAVLVATGGQLALFAPLLWLVPHLVRLVLFAQSRGAVLSKLGILSAVARAPRELRRSRNIVIALSIYFVALLSAWIVFAASKGI